MLLFKRSYLVLVRATLHPPARVAIELEHKEGRWPEYEQGDRLTIGLGLAALAASKSAATRFEALRASMRSIATAIADNRTGSLPGDLVPLEGFGTPGYLTVVQPQGPSELAVSADIVSGATGRVPRMREEPKTAGPTREFAALALLLALGTDARPDDRLTLAFGIEGLLSWYREGHRTSTPKDVLRYALAHVEERLREIDRQLPAGL